MARRLGPAKPRGNTRNGAGACEIPSHERDGNFSRTYCSTFHCRGTTSSVSLTSSPSLASRVDPQHVHAVGPGTMIRSRGRCSANGLREGLLRVKERTVVSAGRGGSLGGELILRGRRLELLKFEFHLVQKARAPLAALPVDVASHSSAASARSEPRSSIAAPERRRDRLHAPAPAASALRRHPGVPRWA